MGMTFSLENSCFVVQLGFTPTPMVLQSAPRLVFTDPGLLFLKVPNPQLSSSSSTAVTKPSSYQIIHGTGVQTNSHVAGELTVPPYY